MGTLFIFIFVVVLVLTLIAVGLSAAVRDGVLGSYAGRCMGRLASAVRVLLPEKVDGELSAYFDRMTPGAVEPHGSPPTGPEEPAGAVIPISIAAKI